MPNLQIDADAFSSGQVSSKLWLCHELENLNIQIPQIVWVYGGWHGIASLLLLARGKFPIKHIRSFDINPECETIADSLLENWVWQQWQFKAVTADCNAIEFNSEIPNLIINCSTEHFTSMKWFDDIPSDTLVALQSNNMIHDDHHCCFDTCDAFADHYKLKNIAFKDQIDFDYPGWQFSRFMIIGTKI
jgi:hypothetical protein